MEKRILRTGQADAQITSDWLLFGHVEQAAMTRIVVTPTEVYLNGGGTRVR